MSGKTSNKAFSLLEVMLATAIFAIAAVVLTSAFSNALTALQTMRRETNDEPIFRYIRSLVITVPNLANFEEGETLDLPDGATITWTAVAEQTQVADLFKVELTMSLKKKDADEPIVRVERLYLLRPTWSDSDDRAKIISESKSALETARRTQL
jgi:general secretion pathway protein I